MQDEKQGISPAKVGWLAGCLLGILIIFSYPGFNSDGVLYLYVAQLLQTHELHQAIAIYSWPFFPALVSVLSTYLHISLLNAAYVYNIIFFASTVSVFVKIIQTLGGNRALQWVAMLSILFYRSFNKYNYYVIRDQGYWCFILLSLLLLLEFFKHPAWYKAVLWSACVAMSALFRIEGIAILLLAPFSIFCSHISWRMKGLAWLKLNTLNIIATFILFVYVISHPKSALLNTPRINELHFELFHGMSYVYQQFLNYSNLMAQHVLPDIAKDNASGVLFSGLLTYYVYLLLGVITWPYLILIFYAWYRHITFLQDQWKVIWSYILINMAITLLFTFTKIYFVDRYFQTIALCFLIFVPFGFIKLYQDFLASPNSLWKKALFIFVLLGWAAMVVSSLFHIGPSKRYIQHAKIWVTRNIPKDARIFTNSGQLAFMTNRQMTGWQYQVVDATSCYNWKSLPNPPVWINAQYLVVDLPQDPQLILSLTQKVGHAPLQIFLQRRPKREVVIYSIKE